MAYFESLEAPEAGPITASLRAYFELRCMFNGKQTPSTVPTTRLLLAYVVGPAKPLQPA